MAASFPTSVKSFPTRSAGQTIASSILNDLQDEVVAIENDLTSGMGHNVTPDGDVTRQLGTTAARWLQPAGTVTAPGVAIRETGTGLYSSAAGALEAATGGVKALGIDSTQFIDSPTQPRAVVFNSATQAVADSTTTAITFDSETTDVGAIHSTSANTSRLTVPTGGDGFYLATAYIYFASNATGVRTLLLNKAGTTVQSVSGPGNTAANPTSVHISWMGTLAAADYLELFAFQTSGGSLNIGNASNRYQQNTFNIVKLW